MTEYSNIEYRPYPNTVYERNTTSRVQHMYTFIELSETLFIDRHIDRNRQKRLFINKHIERQY